MKRILKSILSVLGLLSFHTLSAQVAITNVYPAPNQGPYDSQTNLEVMMYANKGITSFGDAIFSYNDQSFTLSRSKYAQLNGPMGAYGVQLKISYPGLTNYVAQALEAGAESFTITITDVKCGDDYVTGNSTGDNDVSVDNGTVTLTYEVADPPRYISSESIWPKRFLPYWEPGNPDAKATLVFSQDISSVFEVSVVMAKVTQGSQIGGDDLNSYEITPEIEGNKIMLDFAGTMYIGSSSSITVVVKGVQGTNGLPADFGNTISLYKSIPFGNSSSSGNGNNSGNETPENPGDNGGTETPDNPGDNGGTETPDNPGDNGGTETPDNPGDDNGGNETPDNPGDNGGTETPDNPGDDNGGNETPDNPGDDNGGNETPDNPGDDNGGDDTPDNPDDENGGNETPENPDDNGGETPDDPDAAVDQIFVDNPDPVIYNLQGRKISKNNLKPGIYIIDGKKVMIR